MCAQSDEYTETLCAACGLILVLPTRGHLSEYDTLNFEIATVCFAMARIAKHDDVRILGLSAESILEKVVPV